VTFLRTAAKLAFTAGDVLFPTPTGPRLLIYHQIGAGSGLQMDMAVDDFGWQLDWLAANRDVVDLDAAVAHWNEAGSDRLTVLTFDDGYLSVYTTAFPMLREREMPFTLYLATRMIEEKSPSSEIQVDQPLTWEMVREMQASGLVEIGAHTHSHCDLRTIDAAEIESEFKKCDDLIAANTGVVPRHFAYPWGYWSPQADVLVQERYATAVLGAPVNREPEPLPHRLHRFPVQLSDARMFFERRLSGGLIAEELVRRRLRGYRGP
jgi:peptidoglycan/xylan/chitin deacetylase (PgdA/CDA1 family)